MYFVFQAISAALHLLLLCSSRLSKNLGLFGLFLNSANYILTAIDCMKEGTLGSAADSACFYKALATAGTFLLQPWAPLNGGVDMSVIRTGNL